MKCLARILVFFLIANINLFSEEWPKVITHSSGTEVTIYQPQVESFDKINLEFRAAVMINTPKQTDPIFGAVWVNS